MKKLKKNLAWISIDALFIGLIIAGGHFGIVGALNVVSFFAISLAIFGTLGILVSLNEIIDELLEDEDYPYIHPVLFGIGETIIMGLFVWYGCIWSAIAIAILWVIQVGLNKEVKKERNTKSKSI